MQAVSAIVIDRNKMSQNKGLSRKQEIFLTTLLEGSTIVAAAEKAGVTNKTAHQWLDDPTFIQEYEKERKQLLGQSLANLHSKFGKAVETLERHLDNDDGRTIPRDQIEASKTVISQTIQTAQLVERIRELETQLAQQEQEELYIVKFDLRKVTPDERDILRRMNADIAARENNL